VSDLYVLLPKIVPTSNIENRLAVLIWNLTEAFRMAWYLSLLQRCHSSGRRGRIGGLIFGRRVGAIGSETGTY
jgi:hypothetical protein